jgi:flagellar basal body P-ring protein FlgI
MAAILAAASCSGPVIRPQNEPVALPEEPEVARIGDVARPYGMNYVKVEGVSLVTGLDGTGEDPAPSPQRAALLAEMQRRGVAHAAQVLASTDTALVLVRAFLRPGIQKGDRFDVEVRVPSRSKAQSLRNGFLLETRLSELAILGNQIRSGHWMAVAHGPVLVDPSAGDGRDRPLLLQGRVLGGGVAHKSRTLGLAIDTEHHSVKLSQQIGAAINRRFHRHVRGVMQGVANPKTDQFVELMIHPRYKDNVDRYMQVVRSITYDEPSSGVERRKELLARQLNDPVTAATAALRLEAMGDDAIDVLEKGIQATDREVRFYAAEALAYLDDSDAVAPLADVARDEPAFRLHALAAISAMNDAVASEALEVLLQANSAETRYGAFRALSAMKKDSPTVRGEQLGGQFSYHVLDVAGPPMIHVTRSYRPELVLFGKNQAFRLPLVVQAGKHILVNGFAESEVAVSRFEAGKPDQKRVVTRMVDDVIRAIVDLGGTYPDVVQALQTAKESGALDSRLKVDTLPESGRHPGNAAPEQLTYSPGSSRVQ